MSKTFAIPGDQIRPLATKRGSCFATDKVTVEGRGVGYMYRGEPDNEMDSGWRFMGGDEDEAYMDEPGNHAIYDVNTIANYSPAIIPFLDAPIGSAFFRDGETYVPDPLGAPDEAD